MSEEKDKVVRNLFLTGEITDTSVEAIIKEIVNYNNEDNEKEGKVVDYVREPIKIYINSPGGYVYDGFALVDTIKLSKTPIHSYVVGKSMSMAFLIAAVCHKRFASKNSMFMFHQVSAGTWGKLQSMNEDLEQLKVLQEMYVEELLESTGILAEKIEDVSRLKQDWFIRTIEAKKMGIIDEVLQSL